MKGKSEYSVVIIGAGAAGISAATRLVENGLKNVKILEAEPRIGGRIHTVNFGDAPIDLGAEEVHGEVGNIVTTLAKDYLIRKKPLWKATCYNSNGVKIEAETAMKFLENFVENPDETFGSIGEIFTKNCTGKFSRDFLELFESFFCILEGPFSWNDVVMEFSSHYEDCPGDQFLGWKTGGAVKILEILTGKSELDISLNTKVAQISWNLDGKIEITCENSQIFKADFVIFTCSAGVLREKHAELFTPNLPCEKIEALNQLGFANVMKIAAKFPVKWWNSEEFPIGFVWGTNTNFPNENSWISSIHWAMESPGNSRVLILWLTGKTSLEVEEFPKERIKSGVATTLRKFLGKYYKIPDPEDILTTKWYTNSNFKGVYSYETPSTSLSKKPFQEILSEPLKNSKTGKLSILFAGEATHLTQYSTINGAILSGHREADRIIQILKNQTI